MVSTLMYFLLLSPLTIASTLVQIKQDLGPSLQKYERVSGKDSDCIEDFPELVVEGDAQSPVIHLGEKFVFPSVNLPSTSEKSDGDCTYTTSTKTEKLGLKSKITHQCKSEKDNYELEQNLTYNGKVLKLSYTKNFADKNLSKSFECTYRPIGKTKK